jgi:hypothetical protein
MRVGERAKVIALNRPTPKEVGDREKWKGQDGLVMRRLNVPWDPEVGELWEVRFDDGSTIVFSASELAVLRNGREEPLEMAELQEAWGKAPRQPSLPFRRFGAGTGAAPAVLALLVFAIAGVLLVWAGVASNNWMLGAAGAALVLVGIGAAGVLIS